MPSPGPDLPDPKEWLDDFTSSLNGIGNLAGPALRGRARRSPRVEGEVLKMLPILVMSCLIGCTQMPTAVENETGKNIQIDVTYRSTKTHAFGPLEAGNRVRLRGTVDDIESLSYSYDGHYCSLLHDRVKSNTIPGKYGEKHIVKLQACW